MLVSIIMPTYNNAEYINNAIKSVFEQTYKNKEIIVIDDGSTDSTRQVIKPYLHRIKYHFQENKGVASARNKGLELANGDYIAFLDSDDFWFPKNLEIKVGILKAHKNLGAVFSNFRMIDRTGVIYSNGIIKRYSSFNKKKYEKVFLADRHISINKKNYKYFYGKIFFDLLLGNFILTSTTVFKKKCVKEVGMFRSDLSTEEDYEYFLRFSKNYTIGYINLPVVNYRRHSNQLTDHHNVVQILSNVIEILQPYYLERDKIFTKKLTHKIQRRFSNVYKNLGKAYLRQNKSRHARKSFKLSITADKRNITSILYLILSCLPIEITYTIAYLKMKVSIYKEP